MLSAWGAQKEAGVIVVWVTLALMALMGMAALTIDVGRLVIVAQNVQDVVDAAALGAAGELPDQAAARQTAHELVTANNNASSLPEVSVEDADIAFFSEGQTLEGYGVIEENTEAVTVSGQAEVDYIFAGIFGLQSTIITRSAAASRSVSASAPYAIFAGDDSPSQYAFSDNGSNLQIDGTIHSNSKARMNGSHKTVTGRLEYVNDYQINGSHIDIQGGIHESTVKPYPVDYEWDDFQTDITLSNIRVNGSNKTLPSGRIHVTGNVTVNGSHCTCQSALYKVDGNVTFNGSNHNLINTTIVAKGRIVFNGSCQGVTPFVDGVALISYKSTSGTAITFNGASQDSDGLFYAPNGGITFNGANQQIQNGSLIGKTVTINGSGFTINGTVSGGSSDEGEVKLIL